MIELKINSIYGSITHYFHFFYGVLLPLTLYHIQTKETNFILYGDIGPMKSLIHSLPFLITLKDETREKKKTLLAMDTFKVKYSGSKFKQVTIKHKRLFCDFIKSHVPFYIKDISIKPIVFIERGVNNLYKHMTYKGKHPDLERLGKLSGSERRYIGNHKIVLDSIEKEYPNKVQNVQLENTSLYYQYHLFNNAKVIIASHGAALSNIIFMEEGTHVIEIISKQKKYVEKEELFSRICERFNIIHHEILVEKEVDSIDPNMLIEILKRIEI